MRRRRRLSQRRLRFLMKPAIFRCAIETRTSETNATGHIDHTVIPVWFEQARGPIYKLFNPSESFATWNTIIRKLELDFLSPIHHRMPTEVRSHVSAIGATSFTVTQELWQEDRLAVIGLAVIVHYDYQSRKPVNIPLGIRAQLQGDASP